MIVARCFLACCVLWGCSTSVGDEGDGGEGEGETGVACAAELDGAGFADLQQEEDARIELVGPRDAIAGAVVGYGLRLAECCYVYRRVQLCPTWSVSPADAAQIDDRGVVTIANTAAIGTVIGIGATTAIGNFSTTVTVIDPAANPIAGGFIETAELACIGADSQPFTSPIGELVIEARGVFSVTWQADEEYIDYWGSFTIDAEAGVVSFLPEGGSRVPDDVDGEGTYAIVDAQTIELRDLWLGSTRTDTGTPGCGHVFQRRTPRP